MKLSSDDGFGIDVRDVVERMKDKHYGSIGEAFDDLFHDCYEVDFSVPGGVVRTWLNDETSETSLPVDRP